MQALVEARNHIRTTAAEDDACEAAVLRLVLSLHPSPIALDELAREICGDDEDDFGRRDAVERAVRDLACCGLLHRAGTLVLPSRAALRCEELLDR
jgi:hypothetical protein